MGDAELDRIARQHGDVLTDDDLPPLPIAFLRANKESYTADQMRAYARAALAAALAVRQGEPVAWVHNEINAAMTAKTKAVLIADGGASASSVAGYTIPAYAHPAPPCPHIRSSGPPDRATNWCALGGPTPLRYPHGSLGEEA